MSQQKNLHAGHRERLRDKYIRSAGNGMEDHEILELLLFYSIPVRNTNDTAHLLLERFGSIRGVFDADIKELAKVDNLGEKSALLIKTVASCISRYNLCSTDTRRPFSTFAQISEYLQNLYAGEANETAYLMLFNNSMRLLGTERIGSGSVNDLPVNMRAIVQAVYNYNASYVILAHNHPAGIAIPSGSDIEMTYRLHRALECMGINFIDHFIVAGKSCTPILHGLDKKKVAYDAEFASDRLAVSRCELENELERLFGTDKNS